MSKKTILISLAAVIVLAVAVAVALVLLKPPTIKSTNGVTSPDLSKNYGACDLVSTSQIKSALGNTASSLAAGLDTGKGNIGNGDTAQNCVYGLTKPVTTITTDMLTNTFYTTVYVYASQATKDADSHAYDGSEAITGIGDQAGLFTSVDTSGGTTDYNLRVTVGLRYFGFAVRQTTNDKTFDQASAKTALMKLAQEVDYSKFANKS